MVDVAQLRETQRAANSLKNKGVYAGGPALGASGVAVPNNTSKTLLGRISGGTVTVFAIDGVTVGGMTTGEWFKLRPGSTFAVTYSVAPTLQWFED
jgi:hypothetical protein